MINKRTELTHRTLSEGVEHILRNMILSGELHPSERINEAELAESLGMSRGPIREALRRLQTEGLIVYHPHRGTYVTTLSSRDAEEIYTLRGLLEAEAAKLALENLGPTDLARLQQKVTDFKLSTREQDIQALIDHDVEFHHIIVRASQRPRLFEMYKTLDTLLAAMFFTIRTRAPQRFERLPEIHQVLVDALRSGNEKVVMQAIRDHYHQAWRAIAAVSED